MFASIKRIYLKTGNKNVVTKALAKGWITEEEAEYILSLEVDKE